METWLLLFVMSLAVYRLTRLVVADTFPPVLWLRDRLVGGWRPLTDKEWDVWRSTAKSGEPKPWKTTGIDDVENRWVERKRWSPHWLAELLSCPWCAGGWIAGIITAATDIAVGIPAPFLMGFATWALGSLIASQSWA